jgi:hypothetical protein
MTKFSHIGNYLPKYNEYLDSSSASTCVDKMYKKEKGGKVLVKFFEKAVHVDKLKNDGALRKLFDRAVEKSNKLSAKEKDKFAKIKKAFSEKSGGKSTENLKKEVEKSLKELVKVSDKKGKDVRPYVNNIKQGLDNLQKRTNHRKQVIEDKNKLKGQIAELRKEAKKKANSFNPLQQISNKISKSSADALEQMLGAMKTKYNESLESDKKEIKEVKKMFKKTLDSVHDKKVKVIFKKTTEQINQLFAKSLVKW